MNPSIIDTSAATFVWGDILVFADIETGPKLRPRKI